MTRALFWIALLILVIFAVRSKLRKVSKDKAQSQSAAALEEGEPMACCAHCGMYFPKGEALRKGELDYCSPAHLGLPEK